MTRKSKAAAQTEQGATEEGTERKESECMNGTWAKACDAWEDVSPAPETAVLLISRTLWNNRYAAVNGVTASELLVKDIELAGAHIRAWRKSLPEQSRRLDDADTVKPTKRLLWHALFHVYYAAQYRETSPSLTDPAARVRALRQAEAALRTWWKRQPEQEGSQARQIKEGTP
jgi:hypothetical protein